MASGHEQGNGRSPWPSGAVVTLRLAEAEHRAWNIVAESMAHSELVCHDPLNAFDRGGRHRLCRAFGVVVALAFEDAGWRLVPMTEADHRHRIAAGEEAVAMLLYPDDSIEQPEPEPSGTILQRVVRWLLG